jgi:hypothetical protein
MTAVATAIADNRYGVAGVGQPNAMPLLFEHDYGTTHSWGLALWTAVEWGADVVNMSLAYGCGRWSSRHCGATLLRDAAIEAYNHGVSVVASAGNSERDNDSLHVIPCELFHVICVGALAPDAPVAATSKHWGKTPDGSPQGSHWGSMVDVWAPDGIKTAPPPLFDGTTWKEDSGRGYEALDDAGGTSGAAAFVSGAVALIRAADPSLDAAGVINILQQTVDPSSPDSKVQKGWGMLDVFAAVHHATGFRESAELSSPEAGEELLDVVPMQFRPCGGCSPSSIDVYVRFDTGVGATTRLLGQATQQNGWKLVWNVPPRAPRQTAEAWGIVHPAAGAPPGTPSTTTATVAFEIQTNKIPPALPTNLRPTNVTSSGVTLAWDYASGNPITDFQLVRYVCGLGYACNPTTPAIQLGGSARSFVVDNLVGNWSVRWRLQACNAGECSDWVDGPRVDTPNPGSAPTAPTNLHLCGQGGVPFEVCFANRVTLIWNDNASNEDHYKFQWSIAQAGTPPLEGAWNTVVRSPNAQSYSFTSSSLISGMIYYFRVCAYNVYGCSSYSNMVSYTMP